MFALLVTGEPLVRQVFRYNSVPGMWGLNWFLTDLRDIHNVGNVFEPARRLFLANARYLIVLATAGAAVSMRLRGGSRWVELAAFALCLALVLAPGFGYQYLAWPMPLLFMIDPLRALATGLAGGVLVGAMYLHFWVGGWPATSATSEWPRFGVVWGVITWLSLVVWSWRLARSTLAAHALGQDRAVAMGLLGERRLSPGSEGMVTGVKGGSSGAGGR